MRCRATVLLGAAVAPLLAAPPLPGAAGAQVPPPLLSSFSSSPPPLLLLPSSFSFTSLSPQPAAAAPLNLEGKNVQMALNEIAMRNGCVPEWTMMAEVSQLNY